MQAKAEKKKFTAGDPSRIFNEELLRAVSQLEIRARRPVNALLAGEYRSKFHGSGMQFKDFRHYTPGDDIRHMAWNVTARTGRATVKTFEEERELDVILLVDVSGSSLGGRGSRPKISMLAELSALLGLAAIQAGDRLGAVFFNDAITRVLTPKRTRSQALAAVTVLMGQPKVGSQSDIRKPMQQLAQTLKQRSLILILSDFWMPAFDSELRLLARSHEVLLVHCFDGIERGFGTPGVFEICDPETGHYAVLDTKSSQTRKELAKSHTEISSHLEDIARETRSGYLPLSLEDDYLQRTIHFFRSRGPSRT